MNEGDVSRPRPRSDESTALFEPQDVALTHRIERDASGLGEAAFRRLETLENRVKVWFVQDDKVVCHGSPVY